VLSWGKETESLNWEKTTVILLKSILLRGFCFGLLVAGLLGQGSTLAQSEKAAAAPAKKLKVLFLGDRGHHVPHERFDELNPLMADRGIDLTYTESLGDLRLANLKNYDALVVYANIDVIDAEAERGLLDYVRGGGGFVPLHCASFCFRNSKEVVAMIGGQFQRHGTGVFRTQIAKPDHPVMRGFGGFESWDETYVHHLHNEDGRSRGLGSAKKVKAASFIQLGVTMVVLGPIPALPIWSSVEFVGPPATIRLSRANTSRIEAFRFRR
jgi:hypothetical protein